MPNYAFLIKARLKSPRKSLFCWFDSKSDSRAEREIMNILEDNDIESGRGADHQLPVRTDFPVFNDLPEESALDDTWCDRYELPAGGKTWQKIIVAAPAPSAQIATAAPAAVKDTPAPQDETSAPPAKRHIVTVAAQDATFVQRVLGAWLYGPFTEIYTDQCVAITQLQHDMDDTYPQNVLLALRSVPQLLHCFPETIFNLIDAIKSIWPAFGKSPELGHLLAFSTEWVNSHNNAQELNTGKVLTRDDITARWVAKQKPAARASTTIKSQERPADIPHTLDALDVEIACAFLSLSMDIDINKIPGAILRRAKEMIAAKESPWKEWSQKLRQTPGVLNHSRETIFALIRDAIPAIHWAPGAHQSWINHRLNGDLPPTAIKPSTGEDSGPEIPAFIAVPAQSDIKNLGDGIFSVDGIAAPDRVGPFYCKDAKNNALEILSEKQLQALINSGHVEIGFDEYMARQAADDFNELAHFASTAQPTTLPATPANNNDDAIVPDIASSVATIEKRLLLIEQRFTLLGDISAQLQRLAVEWQQ